jgi:hypothetical protein
MALNIAEPLAVGAYAHAAFDAVGPLLLVVWSELGPGLLQRIHTVHTGFIADRLTHIDGPPAIVTESPGASMGERSVPESAPHPASVTGPAPQVGRHRRYEELLIEAKRLDIRHRAQHRRHPASSETVRKRLRVGAATARALVDDVRAAQESAVGAVR